MKRQLYGKTSLTQAGTNKEFFVEYYITELEKGDETYDKEPFGIEVVKKQLIDGIIYHEVKKIEHLSRDASGVVHILELLYQNSVTPVCVADVLDDLLAVR